MSYQAAETIAAPTGNEYVSVDKNAPSTANPLGQVIKVSDIRKQQTAASAITAGTTRTRAGGTALANGVNRVDTSTAPSTGSLLGDGVVLPAAAAGLFNIVINNTTNPIQIYATGSDTVNGVAGATGIAQPPNSVDTYWAAATGSWQVEAGVGYSGQLNTVLSLDAISAAGANQGAATALTADFNRITTATANQGVSLPASAAGLDVFVQNHSGVNIIVYGNGSDTIDDVAGATGVVVMNNSVVLFTCYAAGAWYTEGLATGFAGPGLQSLSFTPTTTAFSGGGQGSAVALTSMINRVSTVAAQGDSVKLPASAVGLGVLVLNRGANPCQVFGAGTDTINGIATATGISQGVNTQALYVCSVAGNWEVPINTLQSFTPQSVTASGALPPHAGHTYVITKAGVAAMTLAAPTAGTDDGIEIQLSSSTAFAHTLTATGLFQCGTASVNLATFAAQAGAGLNLMAFNGKWIVLASVAITFS